MTRLDKEWHRLKLVCLVVAFILTWFINEEQIFNKFFSQRMNKVFSGVNRALSGDGITSSDPAFKSVLQILEAKTETGTVLNIRQGGSMIVQGRTIQAFYTFWLYGENEYGQKTKN